jgi:hypothetical protein
MRNLSLTAKTYILSIIGIGLALIAWTATDLDWKNPGLYLLAALGAVAQTLRVEGPNDRTNYSIAWFVYGFAFLALGPSAALFVVVVAHLAEWAWHRSPWFIQSFNIGNHVLAVSLAGLVARTFSPGMRALDLRSILGLALANLVFVLANHFLVGLVVRLARGQSFAESGVFEFLTLSLDFSILSVGSAAALAWALNPSLALLNILPLVLLYQALRLPALVRQVKEMKRGNPPMAPSACGD